MDQLLLSLQNKDHSQMPVIILPCVCCLKKLITLQNEEENKCSCSNEEIKNKDKDINKKHHHHHHHHHHKLKNSKEESKKNGENEKKKKRKHSISSEVVDKHKNKKKRQSDSLRNDNENKNELEKEKEKEVEKDNRQNKQETIEEEEEEEKDEDNNEFTIKKAEYTLRISKPEWIPPRKKYGERIDANEPKKKKRKPRKKQLKNDQEFIEKNRNSISFTPAVEKSKIPYYNLESVESEYESIDNPLVGDKIQFKVFDCEMEGDEMSFPSFSESDPMIGDVIGKKLVDEVEHIEIKLENGEIKNYPLTLMSDVRLINRNSENRK